jgi:hypothetical protein
MLYEELPYEIKLACRLHQKYVRHLDHILEWLEYGNNRYKAELSSIIEQIIDSKKNNGFDSGNVFFPELVNISDEIYSIEGIDYEKLEKFLGDYNYKDALSQIELENYSNTGQGYKFMLAYLEDVLASTLVKYVDSHGFRVAFESMSIELRIEIRNQLIDRLDESFLGRKYLMKSQVDNNVPKSLFHYSRVEEEVDYLLAVQGESLDENSHAEIFQNSITFSSLFVKVLENLNKFTSVLSHKYLLQSSETVISNALSEARKTWFVAYYKISKITFSSANIQQPITEFLDISEELEVEIFFNNYGELIETVKHRYIIEEGSIKNLFNDEIFKEINIGLSLASLGNAVYNFYMNPSRENYLTLVTNIVDAIDAVNEIETLVFASKGTGAWKVIKIAKGIASLVGVIMSVYDSLEGYEEEDYSVATGHALIATGSFIFFLIELVEFLVGLNLFTWEIPGLNLIVFTATIVAIIILLVGTFLVFFTQDPLMERWVKYNFFGEDWEDIKEDLLNANPNDFYFLFDKDFKRQILKFYNLLYGVGELDADCEIISSLDDYFPENQEEIIPGVWSVYETLIESSSWNTYYKGFVLKIKDQDTYGNRVEIRLCLWDEKTRTFFWESTLENFIALNINPNGAQQIVPTGWNDARFLFLKHDDFSLELKDSSHEDIGSIYKMNYTCKLFIAKDLIEPDGDNRLSHCEVRLDFYDTDYNIPSRTFLIGADV